jgi:hypothetical protein
MGLSTPQKRHRSRRAPNGGGGITPGLPFSTPIAVTIPRGARTVDARVPRVR